MQLHNRRRGRWSKGSVQRRKNKWQSKPHLGSETVRRRVRYARHLSKVRRLATMPKHKLGKVLTKGFKARLLTQSLRRRSQMHRLLSKKNTRSFRTLRQNLTSCKVPKRISQGSKPLVMFKNGRAVWVGSSGTITKFRKPHIGTSARALIPGWINSS